MRKLMLVLLMVCNPAFASKSTFQLSFTVLTEMSVNIVPEKNGLSISTLGSLGAVYKMSIVNGHEKKSITVNKDTLFSQKAEGNEKTMAFMPNAEKDILVTIEF